MKSFLIVLAIIVKRTYEAVDGGREDIYNSARVYIFIDF